MKGCVLMIRTVGKKRKNRRRIVYCEDSKENKLNWIAMCF